MSFVRSKSVVTGDKLDYTAVRVSGECELWIESPDACLIPEAITMARPPRKSSSSFGSNSSTN
ncbi:hypothetical protein MTBSS4_160010 [Magnetospirillum sp. SS-4]|nr:hypothetical protein MTBSS4_160010 [Magnetospirillum sp. SS-4]